MDLEPKKKKDGWSFKVKPAVEVKFAAPPVPKQTLTDAQKRQILDQQAAELKAEAQARKAAGIPANTGNVFSGFGKTEYSTTNREQRNAEWSASKEKEMARERAVLDAVKKDNEEFRKTGKIGVKKH